ncbi:bestrophin-4-like [Ischnura elegans]|uniref:bestrophin-4-like n=1 Tax=Ischnura elegans TaxID=197161 RepID=UPI001ED88910|nr:bestrophin-4-like [Ischnura elegans]
MTVTYTGEVATCRGFGCFIRLLFRWRGGIYKLVWLDLLVFLGVYFLLNFIYRFGLDPAQKKVFENISHYCDTYSNLIPLSFVLGFYVSIVMQRWWNQYTTIPFPDPIAVFVSSNVHGQDERGRLIRRTIMRYVCLCLTMVFTMISPRVKKRFPTLEHFVEAGLLLDNELVIIKDLNEKSPRHPKHWLPIVWAASIVTRARKEGRVRDDFAVKTIIDELNKFRGKAGLLLSYDTISIPLVYTQVVTLAVYSFFLSTVMGRQWLDITDDSSPLRSHRNEVDLYFPIFTTLQFFFYMGWLKVAESLINPFGEDDDDFEVNWMVDRNIQVSYLIVDEMHHDHPELLKDQYWDEVFPLELPHTVASEKYREDYPEPSTANVEIRKDDADVIVYGSSFRLHDGPDMHMDGGGEEKKDGPKRTGSTAQISRPPTRRSVSRVSTRERQLSARSSSSISGTDSVAGSFHRVASVTSVLRRMFSKDPSHSHAASSAIPIPGADGSRQGMAGSTSSTSISKYFGATPSGPGILDQVIPEGDEQATITSVRPDDKRKPIIGVFQLPPVTTSSSSETNATVISMPDSPLTPESPLAPLSAHSSVATTDIELLPSQPGTPTLTVTSPEAAEARSSKRRARAKEQKDNDDDDEENSDDDLGTKKDGTAAEKRQRLKQKFAQSMGMKPSPKDKAGEEQLLMNVSVDSASPLVGGDTGGSSSPEGHI